MALGLSDLTSAEAVQAALDEYGVLGQEAFLVRQGFGRSANYVVLNQRTGEWADSKAIAGVALAYQYPGSGGLSADQFSGGEATVQRRLVALGFEVRFSLPEGLSTPQQFPTQHVGARSGSTGDASRLAG